MTNDEKLMQQTLEVAETAEVDLEEALAMYVTRYGENYRPQRLQALRDDLAKCEAAITALRERLAQPTQEYPLPDDLYESKDWKAGTYAERVEWLHSMYEAKKRELEDYLAQPEQEPMAWRYKKEGGGWYVSDNEPEYVEQWNDIEEIQPLYTTPPRREWVGLTDEERRACTQSPFSAENYLAIEAKLREKNT